MTDKRSWRRRALTLILMGLAIPASAQAPAPRPPDLFVTRLQGAPGGSQGGPPIALPYLAELPPFPVTALDERLRIADLDDGRRVSLTVSRPMPLRELLMLLVTGTPFSLVNDEAVDGTFLGELKDLTMRQALEAVLFPRALDYDVQGTLIRVFPRKATTRLYAVNYLNLRRTSQRDLRHTGSVDGGAATAQGSSASSSDRFEDMSKGVAALLSVSGRLHLDRAGGLLQVTDFADRLDLIGVYVEAVQMRAMRQVRIDARVLDVAFAEGTAAIDWKAVANRAGAGTRSSNGHDAAGLIVANVDLFNKALAEQGVVTTLATPQFVAMNNEPALMQVGTESVYVESASDAGEGNRRVRTNRPRTVLEGLTLSVTAQVSADGLVLLNAVPTYRSRTAEWKAGDDVSFPVMRVSETDTTVRVQDGETIVLSGFLDNRTIQKASTGFGALFGTQPRTTVKSELVILLTPRIVSPGIAGTR